ncbi:MAG: hypothetical protein MZV65_43970 [Chromatiales bacterium]|nr:hypothetical protein [Chromatiales bacterium]
MRNASAARMTVDVAGASRPAACAVPASPAQTVTLAAGEARELGWDVDGARRARTRSTGKFEATARATARRADRLRVVADASRRRCRCACSRPTLSPAGRARWRCRCDRPAGRAARPRRRARERCRPRLGGELPGVRRLHASATPTAASSRRCRRRWRCATRALWDALSGRAAGATWTPTAW